MSGAADVSCLTPHECLFVCVYWQLVVVPVQIKYVRLCLLASRLVLCCVASRLAGGRRRLAFGLRRLGAGASVGLRRLQAVGQQHLHCEADPLGLEDAVGVVEPQHVCGGRTNRAAASHVGRLWQTVFTEAEAARSLTDSGPLAGQRPVLGHQVGVVALARHDFLHLSRLHPLALLRLQKHPEADVGPLCGKLPPGSTQRQQWGSKLSNSI